MAKKYKVKVIKVLLKNGKTAKSGDVISGDKLVNESDAVKGGYVVEVGKSAKSDKSKEDKSEGNKPKSDSKKD